MNEVPSCFQIDEAVEKTVDRELLIIVPCGQKKIWDKLPDAGPTRAKDAYTGSPFTVNRKYAELFGKAWVILSAKFGFIEPDFEIPQPYNVTFKRKATNPVSADELQQQVMVQRLDRFANVIGLGGKEYRQAIKAAFHGTSVTLHFPFAGLAIGKAMQAINGAIAANDPHLDDSKCREPQ